MSDIKISQLSAAEPLTGEELVPVVQDTGNGTLETRKAAVSELVSNLGDAQVAYVATNGDDATGSILTPEDTGKPVKAFRTPLAAYNAALKIKNGFYTDSTGNFDDIAVLGSVAFARKGRDIYFAPDKLRWRRVHTVANGEENTISIYPDLAANVLIVLSYGTHATSPTITNRFFRVLINSSGSVTSNVYSADTPAALSVSDYDLNTDQYRFLKIIIESPTRIAWVKRKNYDNHYEINLSSLSGTLSNNANWGMTISQSFSDYHYQAVPFSSQNFAMLFCFNDYIDFNNNNTPNVDYGFIQAARGGNLTKNDGSVQLNAADLIGSFNGENMSLADAQTSPEWSSEGWYVSWSNVYNWLVFVIETRAVIALSISVQVYGNLGNTSFDVQYYLDINLQTGAVTVSTTNPVPNAGGNYFGGTRIYKSDGTGYWNTSDLATFVAFEKPSPYGAVVADPTGAVIMSASGIAASESLDNGATWSDNAPVALRLGVGRFAIDMAQATGGLQDWVSRIKLTGEGRGVTYLRIMNGRGSISADETLTLTFLNNLSPLSVSDSVVELLGNMRFAAASNTEFSGVGMASITDFNNCRSIGAASLSAINIISDVYSVFSQKAEVVFYNQSSTSTANEIPISAAGLKALNGKYMQVMCMCYQNNGTWTDGVRLEVKQYYKNGVIQVDSFNLIQQTTILRGHVNVFTGNPIEDTTSITFRLFNASGDNQLRTWRVKVLAV